MKQLALSIDSGTSELKIGVFDFSRPVHEENIEYVYLPNLYKPGVFDTPDLPQLGNLLQPQEFQGVYGVRSRDYGADQERLLDPYGTARYKALHFAGIAEVLESAGILDKELEISYACFGFQSNHAKRQGQKWKDFLLSQTWSVQKASHSQPYMIRFKKIFTNAQPYYAAYDLMCNWKTTSHDRQILVKGYNRNVFEHGPILIVDVGSNRVGYQWVNGDLSCSQAYYRPSGTLGFLNTLRQVIYDNGYTRDISDFELLEALKTEMFHDIPLGDEIYNLYAEMIEQLVPDIESNMKALAGNDYPYPVAMWLCGGGACRTGRLWANIHKSYYQYGVHVCDDPKNAIIKGMMKKCLAQAWYDKVI